MLEGRLTDNATCHIVDGDLQLCLREGVMAWVLFDVSTCAFAFQNACLSRFPAFKQVFMSLTSRSHPRPVVVSCLPDADYLCPQRHDVAPGLELPKTYQRHSVRKCLVEVLADQC